MKANNLPKSDAFDSSCHSPSAGSRADQSDMTSTFNISANDEYPFNEQQDNAIIVSASNKGNLASNDASYSSTHTCCADDISCGYKKANKRYSNDSLLSAREKAVLDQSSNTLDTSYTLNIMQAKTKSTSTQDIKVDNKMDHIDQTSIKEIKQIDSTPTDGLQKEGMYKEISNFSHESPDDTKPKVSERIFMTSLIKHTGIALAIIIPLAAFSAYAATPNQPLNSTPTAAAQMTDIDIAPNAIIYKSASVPTTVDNVDLNKYAGTWYEIGRLPMYFQRNCASDVTANYTEKTDGSGIIVTNKCLDEKGSQIVTEGLAKPADATGSKLKVTFLPSWIRWLPVGKADYWVLARDADYKTALVGTPDKKYLWLLARSPNVSQQTYAKYRQIAQAQGYELKEFTLTPHNNQTVKLVP